VRGECCTLKSKEVIAEVFAGMGDDGSTGGWVEEFYEKHLSIV
jgi:hypothetical protein